MLTLFFRAHNLLSHVEENKPKSVKKSCSNKTFAKNKFFKLEIQLELGFVRWLGYEGGKIRKRAKFLTVYTRPAFTTKQTIEVTSQTNSIDEVFMAQLLFLQWEN